MITDVIIHLHKQRGLSSWPVPTRKLAIIGQPMVIDGRPYIKYNNGDLQYKNILNNQDIHINNVIAIGGGTIDLYKRSHRDLKGFTWNLIAQTGINGNPSLHTLDQLLTKVRYLDKKGQIQVKKLLETFVQLNNELRK